MFTWQWWVCQAFVLIALIMVVISNQQKTPLRICIYKGIATCFSFIGLCFLGQLSAIILNAVGIGRSILVIYFNVKEDIKKSTKYSLMSILIVILISLNIIFWVSYQNILSTIIGISMIVVYMQKNPKTIRTMLCAVSIFSSFYYALIGSPMNAVIDLFGFISSLVGLVRIDLHHCGKAKTVVDNNTKETDEDIDTDYYGLN